jgi:hypothetical protein
MAVATIFLARTAVDFLIILVLLSLISLNEFALENRYFLMYKSVNETLDTHISAV